MMKNILLIDKPAGWTSFDVVAKIRGMIRAQYQSRGEKPTKRQLRVGHTGTLDPFATGLVIILLGDACSRSDEFLKLDKVYEATIRLGQTSTTGDPEGEITKTADGETERPKEGEIGESQFHLKKQGAEPTRLEVNRVLRQFIGEITQIPPMHSAIKIGGQRAYKLARAGKLVEMPSRQVTIHSLDLINYTYPELRVRAHVSSGTYIRTLAADIGEALGTGAYCLQLRRTCIANHSVDNARAIDDPAITSEIALR